MQLMLKGHEPLAQMFGGDGVMHLVNILVACRVGLETLGPHAKLLFRAPGSSQVYLNLSGG